MTWRSAICSSGLLCFIACTVATCPAAVLSGRVNIATSKGPGSCTKTDCSDIVLWLENADLSTLHPAEPTPQASQPARMLQKNKRFTPHVLVISRGTTVEFPNLDPIFHNAFSNFDGQIFDLGLYAPGTSRGIQFNRPGIVRIFCNIHPQMSAVIVVVPSSHFTTTARDGSFVLPYVSPGSYRVHFFDERATPATLQLLTESIFVEEPRFVLPAVTISEAGYLPAAHKNKYGRDYPATSDDPLSGYSLPIK